MNIYTNMLRHAGLIGRTGITHAPPGEGSGGEGGTGGDEGGDDDGFDLSGIEFETEGDDGTDLKDILAGFGGTAEDDEDEPSGDDEGESFTDVDKESVAALSTQLNTMIGNMKIPENMIPDDFDPNDRTQMTNLMNKAMQATIKQSLGVVFQPMQLALQQMARGVNSSIDSKIAKAQNGMAANSVIESMVPEMQDPRWKGMLRTVNKGLEGAGKKPKERAVIMRKMLNQMGVKSSGSGDSNRTASGGNKTTNGATRKEGTAALDAFFGKLPKFDS